LDGNFTAMKYICTLLLFAQSLFAFAQQGVKITGKVVDASSKAPVDYATITIFPQGSTNPITGTTADPNGNYTLINIPPGEYRLSINFIGYQQFVREHLVVAAAQNGLNLGTATLTATSKRLNEVVVTSRLPTVENKIDKLVYNAANDITSQGGVALDVLKKVPQVTVDVDGNVELQGNSSVRFLINGKPSSIFGASLVDALQSMPASQIKSIEVITSPGAKYDAEGLGGIINIILKDNKVSGINGNVNLSAGTRLENGSANLNIKSGNLGVSAFFSGNAQVNTRTMNLNDRNSTDSLGRSSRMIQDGYSDFRRAGYESGLSADWALSKKDNITASFGYDHFSNRNSGLTQQQQFNTDQPDVRSSRNSTSRFSANSYDWNLNYKRTFEREGQELDLLYSSSLGSNRSDYSQSQTYEGQLNPFSGSSSLNPGKDRETNISLDYTQPIAKDFVIETGAKTILQTINSSADLQSMDPASGIYAFNPNQSYDLYYDRKVYAGYLSATFRAFNFFDIKAGGRYEHTDTQIDFPGTNIPSYNTFVPSAVISHKFSASSSLKISYTKRIERADYREINPFLNLSDPYNISTGNPLLKPEIGNVFELGYSKSFENGGNLYVAVFSRHNNNDVKPYTNFYPDFLVGDSLYHNVSVTTRQNIGTEQNTGINVSGSIPCGSKINLRTNTFITDRYIVNKSYGGTSINAVVFRVNMNLSYQVTKTFVAEVFGNYNSPSRNIQGRMPKFINYNLAVRKQFMDKKASIGFTTTNPFSKYVNQVSTITQSATMNGQPYSSYTLRRIPYQSFGISLSYRFGKLEFKKPKEEEGNLAKPIDN
jgi:ferric enterobactin receptor